MTFQYLTNSYTLVKCFILANIFKNKTSVNKYEFKKYATFESRASII